jgi:hypothetical protein
MGGLRLPFVYAWSTATCTNNSTSAPADSFPALASLGKMVGASPSSALRFSFVSPCQSKSFAGLATLTGARGNNSAHAGHRTDCGALKL